MVAKILSNQFVQINVFIFTDSITAVHCKVFKLSFINEGVSYDFTSHLYV